MVDLSGRDIPAPCRQPAIVGAEREPRQPGTGAARRAERGRAERAHQEAEGDPGGRAAEARRDHRARRRQGGGRALNETIKNIDEARPRASARPPASGSTPPPSTTSNMTRCARRRPPSSPPQARRCWTPRPRSTPFCGSANLSASDATEAAQTVGQLGNVVASGNLTAPT